MKKILVLTSVLALAACGGGAGERVTQDNIIRAGTAGTVSLEAAKSNSKITSMVSEIGVASDGTTVNIGNTGRIATSIFVYNGKEYVSYKLDDVHFSLGPSNGEVDENEYVTFGLSNDGTGEIVSVVFHDGDSEYTKERNGDKVFAGTVYRYYLQGSNGNYYPQTDSFDVRPTRDQVRAAIANNIPDEYVRNYYLSQFDALGDDWDDEEHMHSEIQNHSFELKGKDLNTKLRYSDFGYDVLGDEDDYSVIAGGYDIKKINLNTPEFANKKIMFSGTAIGAKAYSDGEDEYVSEPISTNNGAASLTFNNGQETLVMPFNNYYTVTVNKNGNNANIAFTDYKGSDNNFKFTKESGITTNSTDYAFVDIKYFGDDNSPSEAVGRVFYEEHTGKNPTFEGAFGMTKK